MVSPSTEGERASVLSSLPNITARTPAGDLAQQQVELLADMIPQLVWMAEPDGHIFWYNRRWYEYTGTTFEQMQGWGWQSVHDPVELPNVLQQWQKSTAMGQPFEMVIPIKGKDGGFHPFLTRVVPIKNAEGNVEGWFGTNTDVTELRRAEKAEQLMIAVVESAEDGIWTKGLDAIIHTWNPAAQRMLGYSVEEIVGESMIRLMPEDRQNEEAMILDCVAKGQRVSNLETVRRRKDGSLVEVALTISPIRDGAGTIVGASTIVRDITERKRAEAALKTSHERFAIAAQAAGQGFWDMDIAANTLHWDNHMFQLYGHSATEKPLPHSLWTNSLHPEDRARCEQALTEAINGTCDFHTEFRVIHPSGEIRHINASAHVARDADGKAIRIYGVNADITARKLLENSRAETLAHLEDSVRRQDVLMAELDHRVKNILATIQALVIQSETGERTLPGFLSSFSARLISMGHTHSLLTKNRWEGAELRALIDAEMAPFMGGQNIAVVIKNAQTIMMRPKAVLALSLGLHELATNAAKYGALSAPGGCVHIDWHLEQQPGRTLVIEWRETGGPAAAVPAKRGFGLTLIESSLSYELGGEVTLGFPPEGLTCRIVISYDQLVSSRVAPLAPAAPIPVITARGLDGARVLVVEDNALIARSTADSLKAGGATVVGPVARLTAGIEVAKSEEFGVATLDIDLDGMRVWPIADILIDRNIPFLFVSGYGAGLVLPPRFAERPVLNKPYGRAQLVTALTALLAGP